MRILSVSVLLLVLLTPALFGQASSSLTGVVTDPSGGVVPGAAITIVNTQTGAQRETVSNDVGAYTLLQVPPGTWQLTARKVGFTSVEIKDVRLMVNTPSTINIKFEKVGGVSETVEVTASAITVNTTDATIGNAITGSTILQLPSNLRNITTLLLIQPGVTEGGQVNGGKSDQANVTLDGVDINDQVARSVTSPVLRVTLDSVQEFRTTTTNANADQGRGSGAEVALVTKSGSNEYHGSLYEYNRNTAFSANTFFNNRNVAPNYLNTNVPCTPTQMATEFEKCKSPIARLNQNVFGTSFGGPIFKNRLFIFGNYEGRRDASESRQTRTVYNDDIRNGIVTYHNAAGTLTKIGPAEIKQYVDPLGIGPSAATLAYFNQFPHCNVANSGDLLNTCTYQFNFARHQKWDTYIAKLDYTVDNAGKHQVYFRGNLQNDHSPSAPQFPDKPSQTLDLSNNKGMATGHTWVIRPNMINSVKYGFTRQGTESTGAQQSSYTFFRNISNLYETGTNTVRFVPVHTISEDFSWLKGDHDLRFGTTMRIIDNKTLRNNTFSTATTNFAGMADQAGLYNRLPGGILSGDVTSYGWAMVDVLGLIASATGNYKYVAKPDGSATLIAPGGNVALDFAGREYEVYAQDSWKIRRNFTITAGIRLSLMPPVHEVNGQQVSPDQDLSSWLGKRGYLASQGLSQAASGDISFILSSMPGGLPLYPYNKNWAPRLGLAYSPSGNSGIGKFLFGESGKTSIRAGFGMYYDLIGQPLASLFAGTMFGLSTSLTTPLNILDASTAPRWTTFWGIPDVNLPQVTSGKLLRPAPPAGFPVKYPANSFAITNSIDNKLLAPYTINMNFSWGRDFGKGLFFQAAYVGRLSRHSLIQRDMAMPTNLIDTQSGMTYFQAMQKMATYTDLTPWATSTDRGNSWKTIAPIAFFEDLWPGAAGNGYTATQWITNFYLKNTGKGDFTTTLQGMDFICNSTGGNTYKSNGNIQSLGCSKLGKTALFSNQFGALAGWSSIGSGNYHAAELTLRKRFSNSMSVDVNYTLSKSIDLGSGNESSGSFSGGFITNTWAPGDQRAVSDYDTLHSINAYGVYALPVGRGTRYGNGMNKILDALLGGWQISGIYRQTSAGTTTTSTGSVWPTNWQLSNPAVPTGLPFPAFSVNKNGILASGATGNVSAFATKEDGLASELAYRQSFPGEYGLRNNIRTWGGYNIDATLAKSFKMPYKEGHSVTFRAEAFNLLNNVVMGNPGFSMTGFSTWGRINSQRNNPRQTQFGLRYDF
jgi:hypothetical protein